MTGIILAGGRNIRFDIGTKKSKAFIKIGNETIIENIINKFSSIFDEILIITNNVRQFNHLTNNRLIKVVKDIIPDKGSLGGLYSGLVSSKNEYSFVVACDMPFLNVELIKYMKNSCDKFDVITPKLKHNYESLHTIYSKNCIVHIEKQLREDNFKIKDFFSKVKINEITEDIIKQYDSRLLSFFNINTEDDYQRALLNV